MADGGKKLLKILCIHGYRQNAQTFRERTGAFRKILKKHAELVFVTAPLPVKPLENNDEEGGAIGASKEDQYGWWYSSNDDSFHAQDYTDVCKGFDQSVEVVKKVFKEQGPFDGVLGFSQGASFVAMLCALREKNEEPFVFDFAIMVAGFRSRSSQHDELYSTKITCPTLHVYGDTDRVIQKEMSVEMLQYFKEPVELNHQGGHFIPTSAPQKKVYLDFLNTFLAKKNS
ncbi:esterase OVCA2-like [Branchiostoma floridae]|uniref:Esterase OVCA2 n=2 Tax=Branchiostoma floridae TaxID=7739 RepID=A0A9J7MA56_BRAFL|nr:esterase OVCA2-like [Branchiostoma floridae]